jgi:hypothetical protein
MILQNLSNATALEKCMPTHLNLNQPVGLINIVFKKSCQEKNGPIKTFKQRGRNKMKVPPMVE